jgi:hypothetical protein
VPEPKSILDDDIPDLQYAAPKVWGGFDPTKELARWRFLKTCKRLDVPRNLWIAIKLSALPGSESYSYGGWAFELPKFNVMHDTEARWKRRAQEDFKKACEQFLTWVRNGIEKRVKSGDLKRLKSKREGGANAPIDLRYEWAVRRYCYNCDYKDLATSKYNPGRVKEAVREIFAEADLKPKAK